MGDCSRTDLEALRRAWPQPRPPSPDAHATAREALLRRATSASRESVRAALTGEGRRAGSAGSLRAGRRPAVARTMALTLGMLAAVVWAVVLAVTPPAAEAPRTALPGTIMPVSNAQVLLGRAAEAAGKRGFTAPRPDQWIYIETRTQGAPQPAPGTTQSPRTPLETHVGRSWTRADGKEVAFYENGKLVRSPTGGGIPPTDYATVAALPTDPDAMLAWMYAAVDELPPGSDEERHIRAYRLFGSLLAQNLVPPAQEAAIYRAMAKIPGVTVNPDAVDVDGRPAVAVARREDWVDHELLLDRFTYTYLGERAIANADHASPGAGTRVEGDRKIVNMGPSHTITKGTIMTLNVRLDIGITDRPGAKP
ncbi:CU044_5270 family protein [Nonomuraea sp. NPDC049695]|uniref:CU044_5270 family protein n=1 Tax=Nonomuraea sp. NPDC049695 TaxID=3154734 RepID=UPI0034159640